MGKGQKQRTSEAHTRFVRDSVKWLLLLLLLLRLLLDLFHLGRLSPVTLSSSVLAGRLLGGIFL